MILARTIFSLGFVLLMIAPCAAQSTWEVTPYQLVVWWDADDCPELNPNWLGALNAKLTAELRTHFVGVCDVHVQRAPEQARLVIRREMSHLTREQMLALDPDLSKQDKLFLVSLQVERQSFRIRTREFDCLLAHFGPVDQRQVNSLGLVTSQITTMITDSFSPVVRIHRVTDNVAKTKLRAAALIQSDRSPGRLQEGDVLLPYDRRVQSSGKAPLQGIRPIDWTYLRVDAVPENTGYLELNTVSGYRQPFRAKRSRRQQQYAIRTRPLTKHSRIRLLSRGQKQPLAGYEIHEKGESTTELLGYTNWRGEFEIPPNDRSIRELLVRSGDRVLAKLPIAPGLRPEIVAYLRDNRQRVRADGFLAGVQNGMIDLVARRESLTTRIRHRIQEKDFAKAESLLNELRDLPTQQEFRRDVELQQSKLSLANTGDQLSTQINTAFVQTISTLGKYLDPNRARELEAELNAARAQNGNAAR